MLVLSIGKKILKKLDLFSSTQFLRFKSDAQTKTLTGGVVSLAIILFLAITFGSMIIETFDKVLITAVADSTQTDQPSTLIYSTHNNGKKFMLGIELWRFDLTTGPRYFDISLVNSVLEQGVYSNQTVDYALEPCTKGHWSGLDNIDALFDRVEMKNWLCMPLDVEIQVSGKYSSLVQRSMDITVSACKNTTVSDRACASQTDINDFINSNSQLFWTPFFLNPLVNPQSSDYLSYYLEDKYYLMSGANYGSELYIYSNEYDIVTDESIFPFTSEHRESGPMLTSSSSNTYLLNNSTDIYCLINFFRGPESVLIFRTYQKIIDAFAYIGGLLGSFLLLLIVVNFYNECSYEMNFAEALYQPQAGSPTSFHKYNIFYYFLQALYNLLRLLRIRCSWSSVKFFHKTRAEMLKQLDVMFLFRKIHVLESAMMLLFSKAQLKGLMLQHEMTIEEVKRIRKMYGLKKDVVKMAQIKAAKASLTEDNDKATSNAKLGLGESFEMELPNKQSFCGIDKVIVMNKSHIKQHLVTSQQDPDLVEEISDSSESSGEERTDHEMKELELFQNLRQLKDQAAREDGASRNILMNIDPRISRILEKSADFKLDLSQPKQHIFQIQVEYEYEQGCPVNLSPRQNLLKVNRRKQSLQLKVESARQPVQKLEYDFTYIGE